MAQITLMNAGDTGGVIYLVRNPFRSPTVAFATSTDTPAGAVIALDIMFIQDEWILGIAVFDAIAHANVNFVTGPSQYAWTDAPGVIAARVRRTDGTGGAAHLEINQVPT